MMAKKPTLVWFQAITCNGNTHSFLSSNSKRLKQFLDSFDIIYHPSLTSNINLPTLLESTSSIDYLLIEGALSEDKYFSTLSNNSLTAVLDKLAKISRHIINIGSCASYGGVHAKFTQNEVFGSNKFIKDEVLKKLDHPLINLTGCPVHPEWIMQTLFSLKYLKKIALDEESRPVELFSTLAHHGCTRNEYFEWKVEAKSFGLAEGCLFYDQGCRGPMTHSSCNKILWNEVNSKTRAGMPCIGCTEIDFPRDNMLETKKNIGIPQDVPLGISKRAYLSLTGVAKTFKIPRLNKKLYD